MQTRVDHLVWAGPDLDRLVAHVLHVTGLQPEGGGSHPGLGTANRLLGLGGQRYLEVIGPDPGQPAPARPRPFGIDELEGPRLVGWAVRSVGLAELVAAARTAGYDPGPPSDLSRQTADGQTLTWQVTPLSGGLSGVVPFVLDWQDTPHPSVGLSALELVSLTLHHPEPDLVRSALLALRLRTGAPVRVEQGAEPLLSAVLDTPKGQVTIS